MKLSEKKLREVIRAEIRSVITEEIDLDIVEQMYHGEGFSGEGGQSRALGNYIADTGNYDIVIKAMKYYLEDVLKEAYRDGAHDMSDSEIQQAVDQYFRDNSSQVQSDVKKYVNGQHMKGFMW